jgi:hypothetical protein
MGLDLVEILMEIEDDFGVTVPDELASSFVTVGDTHKMIFDHLVAKGRTPSRGLDAEVWQKLVTLTPEQMGLDPEIIKPDLRWIPDITKYG